MASVLIESCDDFLYESIDKVLLEAGYSDGEESGDQNKDKTLWGKIKKFFMQLLAVLRNTVYGIIGKSKNLLNNSELKEKLSGNSKPTDPEYKYFMDTASNIWEGNLELLNKVSSEILSSKIDYNKMDEHSEKLDKAMTLSNKNLKLDEDNDSARLKFNNISDLNTAIKLLSEIDKGIKKAEEVTKKVLNKMQSYSNSDIKYINIFKKLSVYVIGSGKHLIRVINRIKAAE